MKLIATLLLAFTTIAAATALSPEQAKRAVNCDDCNNRYKFCLENGGAPGITHCADTCAQHVCYQTPDCRGCGSDFIPACPEVSRYHKGCGDRQCAP